MAAFSDSGEYCRSDTTSKTLDLFAKILLSGGTVNAVGLFTNCVSRVRSIHAGAAQHGFLSLGKLETAGGNPCGVFYAF